MGTTHDTEGSSTGEAARGRPRHFASLLAALLLAHTAAIPAAATVFVVTSTSDSGAGSLRQAILDANASVGPDEITFSLAGCPCTVSVLSPLSVSEELTITGPGMNLLTLHGGDVTRVLFADLGIRLAISDLTVRNAYIVGWGAAIWARGPLVLTRVTVRNNTTDSSGAGVYSEGELTIVDSVLRDNVATTGVGAGVFAVAPLTVSGSLFQNNQSANGGGGLYATAAATVSDTDFIGNRAGSTGGGAYVDDAAMGPSSFTDVRFIGNTAQNLHGGGLFVHYAATLTAVDAIANYAGQRGGGIYGSYLGNHGLTLTGGRMLNNSAQGGGGLTADGDVTLDDTELSGNVSRNGHGGGLYTQGSAVLSNATVRGNVLLNAGNGAGIYTIANLTITGSTVSDNENFASSGGGSGSLGTTTVTDCTYEDNFTQNAGGAFIATGAATVTDSHVLDNTAGTAGGGIYAQNDFVLASSEVSGNEALTGSGGGVYVVQGATVTDTVFAGNTGRTTGGGLHVQSGAAEVTGGRFEGNLVMNTGRGGGLYCIGPSCQVDGTEFVDNVAEHRGGGVATGGSFSVSNALFQGNDADFWGGAIYATGAVDVQRTRFVDNGAGDLGGAIHHNGGSGGDIANSLFARNHTAAGVGDAIALQAGGPYSIVHSTLATHPSQAAGSALYVNANSVDVRNSIIASHAQGIVRDAGTVTANFNLFHDNGVDVQGASITNANVVTGAPDFVDPASDDYHLSIGSAALDAGPDMGAIVDFDGESRPQGAGFDLGYDELSLGAPTGCPVTPAASCGAAASDALQIAVGADPAKSKLTLKHVRATAAIAQADFGDPAAGGNAYQLCVYDASAGTPGLVATMIVPGGGLCGTKPCWKAIPGKGYVFKDKTGAQDGIRQLVLRSGEAGKGALLLKGAGTGLPLPGPKMPGIPYFDADPDVAVQLHESSTGNCWESRVGNGDVQVNTEALFKATRK